jgi:hypothetical protein
MFQNARPSDEAMQLELDDTMTTGGPFQADQPLKHKRSRWEILSDGLYEVTEFIWMLYVVLLNALSLSELQQTGTVFRDPVHTLPTVGYTGWLTLNSIAVFTAFLWLIYSIIHACRNAVAVSYQRIEKQADVNLPHAPLKKTVMWNLAVLIVWSLAFGFAWQVFDFGDTISDTSKAAWFISTIWITFTAGVITSLDYVCKFSRMIWDWVLRACNSSCYDC